jgi:hypothetical protein
MRPFNPIKEKFNYNKLEFDKLRKFSINDLKYGIQIQVISQSGKTKNLQLTKDCMDELNLFFKEYQTAVNNNPEI